MQPEIPFAPGESPFRSKGNVYRALLESADARVPGGHAAVLASLTDPRLIQFYAQSFLAGASYDLLPLVPFGQAGARLANLTYPEFVRGGAAFTAERDMRGIYKLLLKVASPTAVAQRLPRILLQYFNFGKVEKLALGDGVCSSLVRGIPRPVNLWLVNVAHGFMPVVLRAAGARAVNLNIAPATTETYERGVELVQATFTLRWS